MGMLRFPPFSREYANGLVRGNCDVSKQLAGMLLLSNVVRSTTKRGRASIAPHRLVHVHHETSS